VVLDFRGEGLLGTLAAKPLIVKPNREELVQTVGHPIDNDEQLLAAMRSLNQRGAQWVVITQGGGPIWVTSATQTYKILPLLAKKVVNPIGCGDAMAAGIAWAIREGRTVIEAVRVGIAAATDNIQRLETCRLDHQWVGQHAQQVQVEDFGHGN
jgi:fructose-1-phosphate kinase PfkB-like protein